MSEPAPARILVVDDNEDMRESMRRLLALEGFEVMLAADGARAIEALRREPADLVITDLLMPHRDGIETIAQLRKDFPLVKIVAMSGGGARVRADTHLLTAGVLGADAVLKKPFDSAFLLKTLRELLP